MDMLQPRRSVFQMQIWQPLCLYPVLSCLWCQCCLYMTTYVLYDSVLYYPAVSFYCGANCGFNVSSAYKLPRCILQYCQHTSPVELKTQEYNVATTRKLHFHIKTIQHHTAAELFVLSGLKDFLRCCYTICESQRSIWFRVKWTSTGSSKKR